MFLYSYMNQLLLQLLTKSLLSGWTIIAAALVIGAFFAARIFAGKSTQWLLGARVMLLLSALAVLVVNFYNTVLEIPQGTDLLAVAKEFPDDADCGKAWTGFIPAGIGLPNPCKKGCYRGINTRQQLRVRGLLPEPEYNREFQCFVRKDPAGSEIPARYQLMIDKYRESKR